MCENEIRVDLMKAEQQALDNIDQQHTAAIEDFKETVESDESLPETLREVKNKIKEVRNKTVMFKLSTITP